MNIVLIGRAAFGAVLLFASSAHAQTAMQAKITELAIYELDRLFDQADVVASVKVISGDSESYQMAVYRARVVKGFKGVTEGQVLYVGPYEGGQIGSEYVLFLRDTKEIAKPVPSSRVNYGAVPYFEVFNQGYGSMLTSYECIFDGKDVANRCDYGVRVCTDYIKLPPGTPVFPPAEQETPFGCRMVRRSPFLALLGQLQKRSG